MYIEVYAVTGVEGQADKISQEYCSEAVMVQK